MLKEDEYYKTPEWRSLRLSVLRQTPYCYNGLYFGRLNEATEIHHVIKWSELDDDAKWKLFTDPENLIPLTKESHRSLHGNKKLIHPRLEMYILLMKDYLCWKYLLQNIIIKYTNDKNYRKLR